MANDTSSSIAFHYPCFWSSTKWSFPISPASPRLSNDSKFNANDARNITLSMRSRFTDTSHWVFRAEGSGAAALFDTTWIWILVETGWD